MFTAPLDYISFTTTLTFQVGATGSRALDAECTNVVLLDDNVPEERECFTFNIESLDPDLIEVDEGRSRKELCIVDNDGLYHLRKLYINFLYIQQNFLPLATSHFLCL